jgi:DNA modification methylase
MTHLEDNTGRHFVYCGDCVPLMADWKKSGIQVDFAFSDPPFNIGQKYDVHDDRLGDDEFSLFTFKHLVSTAHLVRDGGIMCVNVPDAMVLKVETAFNIYNDERGIGMERIDWIIWHYRFGQCGNTKFISSHTHCLVYRKGTNPHTWNPNEILVESDRHSKYSDHRTYQSETPGLRVPLDVWCDIPRVTGNAAERVAGRPNQLPWKYLDRLIRAYTNPGDLLLDPFGGSGTTAEQAKKLGRRSVSIDVSETYCNDIVERLNRA